MRTRIIIKIRESIVKIWLIRRLTPKFKLGIRSKGKEKTSHKLSFDKCSNLILLVHFDICVPNLIKRKKDKNWNQKLSVNLENLDQKFFIITKLLKLPKKVAQKTDKICFRLIRKNKTCQIRENKFVKIKNLKYKITNSKNKISSKING